MKVESQLGLKSHSSLELILTYNKTLKGAVSLQSSSFCLILPITHPRICCFCYVILTFL